MCQKFSDIDLDAPCSILGCAIGGHAILGTRLAAGI